MDNYNQEFKLCGFSDSDWGGSTDDMKSISGYCFTFGGWALVYQAWMNIDLVMVAQFRNLPLRPIEILKQRAVLLFFF